MAKTYTITLTERQATLVLRALEYESYDDGGAFDSYSFGKCYNHIDKKLAKAGYYDED